MIPSLVPLILPLTILVTSIMTFGNFAENNEFAAMKSAGISLQRAMSGLIVFIILLGYVTYQFSNTIIPWSENRTLKLRRDLAKIKPAMAINENMFSKVGSYVIRVEEKSGENGQYLKDVYIRKKGKTSRDNNETIKSKTGEFISGSNPNLISLVLRDGNYYNEVTPSDYRERQRKPFVKTAFKEHILNIDISELNKNAFTNDTVIHPYKGLNTKGLLKNLDSVSNNYVKNIGTYNRGMNQRNGFLNTFPDKSPETKNANQKFNKNNNKRNLPEKSDEDKDVENDSIKNKILHPEGFFIIDSLLLEQPKRIYSQVLNSSKSNLNALNLQIKTKETVFATKSRILNRIELELHKKYALGISCIVLFFVGAPLGAIIRKGGLGLPLVVSILLFLTYHFFGIFAGNSAETGSLSPFLAAWIATFVMLPLGVYLTYRATTDQGFINTDVILDPIKKLLKQLKLTKIKNDDDK
jgi:lipopolysaccharide export system permease protein